MRALQGIQSRAQAITFDPTLAPDADFDSFWEEEARNPNRNRIRIGRQYQATVPPLLRPGESDGRKLEDLETLKWKPENELSDEQLDQYLSLAKAVTLFARAIDNNTEGTTSAANGGTGSGSGDGEDNNQSEAEKSIGKEEEKETEPENPEQSSASGDPSHSALKGLSDFVTSHHPCHHDVGCKVPIKSEEGQETTGNGSSDDIPKREWTSNETHLFTRALEVCGKNFSAIKRNYLPWKSVKNIIEHYYLESTSRGNEAIDQQREADEESLSTASTNCSSVDLLPIPMENKRFSLSLFPSSSKAIGCHSDPKVTENGAEKDANRAPTDELNHELSIRLNNRPTNCANGMEVKALKAKPILPSMTTESAASSSTIGSLKFFMDGQLVLKLNAKQEVKEKGKKCQWVESQDTPKLPKPLRKAGKRLVPDVDGEGKQGGNSRVFQQEDGDEGSWASSDDDSLGSSESNALASPSSVTTRKAKVKVESNCFLPLPSAPSSTATASTTRDHLFSCNRLIPINESCVKKELLFSPSNSGGFSSDEEVKRKKSKSSMAWTPEKKSPPLVGENSPVEGKGRCPRDQPPAAHASSSTRLSHPNHLDSSSAVCIPVDLTRKSHSTGSSLRNSKSPFPLKSPERSPSSDCGERKDLPSSPRPPKTQTPISPFSPTSQSKGEKPVTMCQKDGRLKGHFSPEGPTSEAQLAWLQSSLVSYLPFYEQYYQYCCRVGFPPANDLAVSAADRMRANQVHDELESSQRNNRLPSQPFLDKDEEAKGQLLFKLLNKDKSGN